MTAIRVSSGDFAGIGVLKNANEIFSGGAQSLVNCIPPETNKLT